MNTNKITIDREFFDRNAETAKTWDEATEVVFSTSVPHELEEAALSRLMERANRWRKSHREETYAVAEPKDTAYNGETLLSVTVRKLSADAR